MVESELFETAWIDANMSDVRDHLSTTKQAQNNITVYRHNSSFTLPVILSPKVAELVFVTLKTSA